MNENMDDLPARESAHGPHHGLDSADSPLAGPFRPEEAGRGSTVRGQTSINTLREE